MNVVKVGDKVKRIMSLPGWEDAPEILVVKGKDGGWISVEGNPMNGKSGFNSTKDWYYSFEVFFEEITETEAERRGAKFGVMGVYNPTGHRAVVVSTDKVNTPDPWPEKERWIVSFDGSLFTHEVYAENIRLDHEPEFVAWSEAPEHLRYDASRVYCDGKPVKWIAKPEGAFVDVAVVLEHGLMEFSTHNLTVKL